jgi:hypothetical protein
MRKSGSRTHKRGDLVGGGNEEDSASNGEVKAQDDPKIALRVRGVLAPPTAGRRPDLGRKIKGQFGGVD